jgi:hypothetical protein
MLALLVAGMTAGVLTLAPTVAEQPPPPSPTPDGDEQILGELLPRQAVGKGVTYREFTTTATTGTVMGDVVEVDLADPAVRTDLLTPGSVAARASVAAMADRSGAVAGINGDFFDIGRTSAPVGPAVAGGRPLKAAVPHGRRMGPAVPGAEVDHVFSVGVDGIGRIDRLRLDAEVTTGSGTPPAVALDQDTVPVGRVERIDRQRLDAEVATESRTLPAVALNQYAVPVDGIGIFTPDWGTADRGRTLCGSDTDRDAPCAADQAEVLVHDGKVVLAGPPVGGTIPEGGLVLTGREQGAESVRSLEIGDAVEVEYALVAASGTEPQFAIGGSPIMVAGVPVDGLDDRERAPRSAVGTSEDGHRMWLVTLDGRQSDSVGATLSELAALLQQMGVQDAVNLDGGGSSTLVHREQGASEVTIVNDPSDPSPRLVPNGIGVYVD